VVTLPAHLVATPVLERRTDGSRGAVLGAGDTADWIDHEGFVVVITTREVPLMPNAIAVSAGSGALVRTADGSRGTARLVPGRVAVGALQITWDPSGPPTWDPTVPVPTDTSRTAVAARGAALLHALGSRPTPRVQGFQGGVDNLGSPLPGSATLPVRGPQNPGLRFPRALGPQHPGLRFPRAPEPQHPEVVDVAALVRELARIGMVTAADPKGAAGLTLLFRAVRERDPEPAAAAVRDLLGRGPGLTPEGDDLLAAVAGTLAVLGPAMEHDGSTLSAVLEALAPIPGRTTALSATLLTLALERRLPEPAGRLLDLTGAGETAWPAALARLERLGHGSGRAYAAGIAATAVLLAGPNVPVRR
jgi:hypothetical protein